ncbi:retinol dehydrogenase 16-like [Diadema antillarum]|uniref:retinol dehydrogenase 16-like n=1 Tax=Diadema antillarum TaxID=105358 RepID=UPI003A8C1788
MIPMKLFCYSAITLCFNGAVLRRYLREELMLAFPYTFFILLPTIAQPLCQLFLGGFCGVTVFAIACYYLYRNLPQQCLEARGKVVFITGCEHGLAHAAARHLDSLGFHVYAAFLTEDAKAEKELAQACSDRLVTLSLDPSDDNRVTSTVEELRERLNGKELWGLVNGVSVCYYAESEIMSPDLYRKLWTVNVEGQIRVTRALLPLIRRSRGRIVNITGISDRLPAPGFSAFCATKAALLMYSDVLRLELVKWAVRVSVIEPSEYRASFNKEGRLKKAFLQMKYELNNLVARDYGEQYFADALATVEREDGTDFSPDQSAPCRAVEHALLAKNPHEHYACDKTSFVLGLLTSHAPTFVTDTVAKFLAGTSISARSLSMLADDCKSKRAGLADDAANENFNVMSTKGASSTNVPDVPSE